MPGGLFIGVEVLLAVLILLAAPIIFLALRRRLLSRAGGAFDCSVRLHTTTPGSGWVLGVARYTEMQMEWFRFFSFRFSPQVVISRTGTEVWEVRDPDPVEAVTLYTGHRVVKAESEGRTWQIAMSSASVTGLLSWLESAPPGQARRSASPVTSD